MTNTRARLRVPPSGQLYTGTTGQVMTKQADGTDAYADPSSSAAQPFRATYYVDPLFTGTQFGSQSNPFTTAAAAFAAAAALAITSGILYFPPGATISENITIPNGNWELACQQTVGVFGPTFTGTFDISCTSTARRSFTNLTINNAVTGQSPNGTFSRVRFYGCFLVGGVNLTGVGAGGWRCAFVGSEPVGLTGLGGVVQTTCAVVGDISATNYRFLQGVTVTFSAQSDFTSCDLPGGASSGITSNGAGQVIATLLDCTVNGGLGGPIQLAASSGSLKVQLDQATVVQLALANCTTSGTVIQQVDLSARASLTGNLAATNIGARYPTSKMTVTVALTLLAAGTAGSAQVQVTYTDLTGTLRTVNVGGALLVTSAVGTEVSGSVTFNQNGATPVQISVTGVVTPGALSMSLGYDERIAA